ncbi:acyl-CoA reductase-like NAD-dependent aldehyde dehydrogenase [Burkholderia sp. OAS925]|uniref:aldehyde dehydrogenase n=1 Tax=Paraburkholderia TaxID=1822464 RepID=UPI00178B883C|nr:aldehyde dehydrogenase [Paraburkholderia graminis]MDR6475762.1 aldehyde dehydrogenase (NAD+) [Paraburkholderia graminis]
MKTYQHWINGEHVAPSSGQWLDTLDPYHGTVWARIARGNSRDADRAVTAARHAMYSGPWATMTASQRGQILRRIGDLLAAPHNAQLLSEIESRDNGKILAEMRGQLKYLPEHWYYFSGLADKLEGSVIPVDKADMLAMTLREPVGVVAALTAWNSPLAFFALKCAPALAAGCAVVLKPSEFASASSLEFAALTKQAGLPDGVINVVTGLGKEIGSPLVEHPDVAKVTFTGSDKTGAMVYEAAARGMKRVSMELGGKSPNIVFEDADLDEACVGVVAGIFGATGQMCTAGSRLLVQNSIKPEFTERLLTMAGNLKLGDPMSPETEIGPIATPPQFEKVMQYIDLAKSEGARCILGGAAATGPGLKGGMFVQPTIFTDVTNKMRIAQEEVFGPMLSIIGFDTEDDAIDLGNDIIYGLAAGVWTQNMGRALRMSKALRAGMVWVNTYRAYSCMVPIGGMKHSGLGRESGLEAVSAYLETKSVMISAAPSARENAFLQR